MAGSSVFDSGLAAVNTTVAALWRNSFNEAQNNLPYQLLTTDMGQGNARNRSFDWFGESGEMQEMNGTTPFDGFRRYNYTVTHTEYSTGLKVRISDINTDQLGQIAPRVTGRARKAAGHPGRLALAQLEANPTGYDSAAYFANTHAFGLASNADNLAAGSGVTASDIEADLATNRATMARFQDDAGVAMSLIPDLIVIPPELSLVFGKVLGPTREAGGNDTQLAVVDPSQGNVWQAGGYTIFEWAGLSDTNNWYLFHTKGEVKPFIYSWITQPRPLNTPSLNDSSAVHHAHLEYVFYGEYAVGVTLPQFGIAVVN